MDAIILSRVSTEEQREAGNSLPSQSFRLNRYCRDRGFSVVKEFSFDESAYKKRRRQFAEVVKLVSRTKKPVVLCCDKIDRLIRNFTSDLVTLDELRTRGLLELHFPSDGVVLHKDSPAPDLFRFNMGVGLARYYSDAISDNVKRAYEQKLRKGEWIGPPRIGYVLVHDDQGRREHVPDPQKAHLITRMFELYSTGTWSFKAIRNEMGRLGLVGRHGKPLSTSMVAHIIGDPFYNGTMVSKGVSYPHRYKRLTTPEVFQRCQAVRRGWNKKPVKYSGIPFIFRGLLKCARCGCTMSPEMKKRRYVYYGCTNARGVCRRIYVPEPKLLEPVYDLLRAIRLPQAKIKALIRGMRDLDRSRTHFDQKDQAKLRKERDVLKGRTEGLLPLLLDRVITKEEYETRRQEWGEQLQQVESRIQGYERPPESVVATMLNVLTLASRALELFESSEIPEKRQMLNLLLQNPVVDGRNLIFQPKSPFGEIASVKDQPILLPVLDTFRTLDWDTVQNELSDVLMT